jgi:phosphatidylglycerophosphate synthase
MLDRYTAGLIKPLLDGTARALARRGVTANQLTVAGFGIGLFASILIAFQAYLAGSAALLASRLLDGLDGAVARQTTPTDRGGFLDIALDFVFYASVPLAFAMAAPEANALAAAALLAGFVCAGTSFLAYATLAAKRGLRSTAYPDKSFYFLGGLTEATETLAFFVAMCLWPQHFAVLAWVFAGLCAITAATRILHGWHTLGPDADADQRPPHA